MKTCSIAQYLNEDLISFLSVQTREQAIYQLVEILYHNKKINDKDEFLNAVLEREKIVSTGIGMGVAIPHAKLTSICDFFIIIGIQKKQPLYWDSIDNSFVNLIFMIGGPENRQNEYLQILSLITMAIKNESLRKNIIGAKWPQKVFSDLVCY